jgi:HrpA-like RNA helicase
MCQLPCDAKISRLLCFGHLFGCLNDVLTLAAILTQRRAFFQRVNCDGQNENCRYCQFTDMLRFYDSVSFLLFFYTIYFRKTKKVTL